MKKNHSNIEQLLFYGNRAQILKLNSDSDKVDFLDHSMNELIDLLIDEVEELNNANGLIDVEQAAAKVANFAHMIILKCAKFKGELE